MSVSLVSIGSIVLLVIMLRLVPFVLFPGSVDELIIEVEMSPSAPLRETEQTLDKNRGDGKRTSQRCD